MNKMSECPCEFPDIDIKKNKFDANILSTSTIYITQKQLEQQFLFKHPIPRGVIRLKIEMISANGANGITYPGAMVSLRCNEIIQSQRGNVACRVNDSFGYVNIGNFVWLESFASLTSPGPVLFQSKANEYKFQVPLEISSLNFSFDSYPIPGQLTIGPPGLNITWKITLFSIEN